MRGAPACVVMRPKFAALKLVAGFPQLKVLNRLNASNRSSSRCVPDGRTSFETARSTCQNFGPTATLRIGIAQGAQAPAAQRRLG